METEQTRLTGLRVAINTQTPLVRFQAGCLDGPEPIPLDALQEGIDYKLTTGGVTRMLLPLLKRWRRDGIVAASEWVAMGSDGADHLAAHDGLAYSFVGLPSETRRAYAQAKERMWALLNSNPSTLQPYGEAGVPEAAWIAYDAYQRRCALQLEQAAARMGSVDLLYVHDFQQVGVARAWRGPRTHRLFHLHTPFPQGLPEAWADFFVHRMRAYDAVVVSTRRYAENLRRAGLRDVPVHVVHPFIDPNTLAAASSEDVARLRDTFDLRESDRVVLNVGRMDPMKGQDRLIRAFPRVLERVPDARLVLVGNGSFSSSKRGGLGLSKGERWRAKLEALARELRVEERVVFTGHLQDDLLAAAYQTCDAFALPSTREGFGLAAVEAWRHRKPIVVSDRAGVAELVDDHVNGVVADCNEVTALADALVDVLQSDEARTMGEAGFKTSEQVTLDAGSRALAQILEGILAHTEARPRARA